MVIYLKNKNKVKKGFVGFSFTTFFFGGFVPLIRGDFKMFIPLFLIYLTPFYFMPYTLSNFDGAMSLQMTDDIGIFNMMSSIYYFVVNVLGAFFYNRIYTQGLIKKGFRPVTDEGMMILQTKGIKVPKDSEDEDEE